MITPLSITCSRLGSMKTVLAIIDMIPAEGFGNEIFDNRLRASVRGGILGPICRSGATIVAIIAVAAVTMSLASLIF